MYGSLRIIVFLAILFASATRVQGQETSLTQPSTNRPTANADPSGSAVQAAGGQRNNGGTAGHPANHVANPSQNDESEWWEHVGPFPATDRPASRIRKISKNSSKRRMCKVNKTSNSRQTSKVNKTSNSRQTGKANKISSSRRIRKANKISSNSRTHKVSKTSSNS
ncbi:hypothetical protein CAUPRSCDRAFT_10711 [Caulochytrium protostelioides]|uniref:Uncharacterized protein n=1 Tax=Caulochytrium protostelioides TaxID=1555241 RepID=A0A4P9WW63_9FUNG|nr:hypothetical protein CAUPRSCDRAFT_10711 [Caulochytrium protostelioides]